MVYFVQIMTSVQERKENMHTFMNSYPFICRLHNVTPNSNITINSSSNCLDLVGDKLKLDDWKPILEAISNDRSLHYICIKSKQKVKVLEDAETENGVRQMVNPKLRPLFTSHILLKLTEALSSCLSNSPALTGLLIEKLPLSSQLLNNLTQGLAVCHNLQHLSLPYTDIGDDGCSTLCKVLRSRLNLIWLNLTGCGLTDKGVGALCNLLKFQKLNRYGECWKQSLRYRAVNPNIMPGLRRLTLNNNPIGDIGVTFFVDSIVDDIWLKALDLQHCDVTLVGAEALLSLVKENQYLAVVDIRGNMQVPNSLVAAIVQQLAVNNSDTTPEFQWLKEDNPKRTLESITGTSLSRSSRQLVSNTSLLSKRMSNISVLPNKKFITMPPRSEIHCPHTRSNSAVRFYSTNNTPRLPWNWNNSTGNSKFRMGNSEHVAINNRCSQGKLSELHSIKIQLKQVSQRLQDETEKRLKIEDELERYKQVVEIPDSFIFIDKTTLYSMFKQFCDTHKTKEISDVPKFNIDEFNNEPGMKICDSLKSVIKSVNSESHPNLDTTYSKCNSYTTCQKDQHNHTPCNAQLIFESLISS